jgi:DNA polymerase III subunit gamma/tau
VSGRVRDPRILLAAGACLLALVGSFALSRPDSQADSGGAALPPADVVRTVQPAPLPELGEASRLPALARQERPRKVRQPVVVTPIEPEESLEPETYEPETSEPETYEPEPETYVPPPPPPPEPTPEPEPEPPPAIYFDDSG